MVLWCVEERVGMKVDKMVEKKISICTEDLCRF